MSERHLTKYAGILVATLAGWSAEAGQLRTEIRLHQPNVPNLNASVSVTANPMQVKLVPGPNSYEITIQDPQAVIIPLNVEVNQVPQGYESTKYQFDIPYFWADQTTTVVGALSNDLTDDTTVQQFIRSLSQTMDLTRIGNVYLLNQRAKRIYRSRKNRIEAGAAPLRIDVSVAYYLLFTARELSDRQFVAMDATTEDAKAWLLNLIATRPPYYDPVTVPPADVTMMAAQLNAREGIVYSKTIERIDRDLSSTIAANRAVACARARALHVQVRNLDDEQYERIAKSKFAIHLRITTDVAFCLAQKFEGQTRANEEFSSADREAAREVFDDLAVLLPQASGAERMNAIGRRADLARFVSSS